MITTWRDFLKSKKFYLDFDQMSGVGVKAAVNLETTMVVKSLVGYKVEMIKEI